MVYNTIPNNCCLHCACTSGDQGINSSSSSGYCCHCAPGMYKSKCSRYAYMLSLDKRGDDIAKGGAALFLDGRIIKEIPSGKEDVLVVEV